MFKNIGKKIKAFAITLTWVGIIGSVISGLLLMAHSVILGFLVIFIGAIASWLSSFTLYGYGQLIAATESTTYYSQQCLGKLGEIEEKLDHLYMSPVEQKENAEG